MQVISPEQRLLQMAANIWLDRSSSDPTDQRLPLGATVLTFYRKNKPLYL